MSEDKSKIYACPTCQLTFSSLSHLKRHFKVHSENRDYVCTLCGNSYKYRKGLNRHMKKSHPSQASNFIGQNYKRIRLIPEPDEEATVSLSSSYQECRKCGMRFGAFVEFIEHSLECGTERTTPFPM
jgi:uncharacterized Zn-finger protein